jgi:hypothetical protein
MRSCTFNIPNRLLSAADRVEVEGVCGGRDAAELLREGGCAVTEVKQSFDAMVEAEAAFKADLEKLLKNEGHMPEDKYLLIVGRHEQLTP